jgi:ribosome-associated protein
MTINFRDSAKRAARAASDKKAIAITVLDLRQQSDVADYVVIAGVDSSAQMRAVEESIESALERAGLKRLHRDGRHGARWIAMDYGGLMVHIMVPQAREFYRLDSLWENPKQVDWEGNDPPPKKKKSR